MDKKISEFEEITILGDNAVIPVVQGNPLNNYKISVENLLKIISPDKNYIHTQSAPSDNWTIIHTLNKYPSVTIIDSGGTEVIGDIKYIDTSTVLVTFASGFSGKAILN